MDVSRVVGGNVLFEGIAAILILANLGAGLSGVSRLLFGMGREGVLPRRFFVYLDPKRNTPLCTLLLIGVLAFAGGDGPELRARGGTHQFWSFPGVHGRECGYDSAILLVPLWAKPALFERCASSRSGISILPGDLAEFAGAGQDCGWRVVRGGDCV